MATITDRAKDRAKKNPTLLLGVLLLAHGIALSLNHVPGQPGIYYFRALGTVVAWPFQYAATHGFGAVTSLWRGYVGLRDTTVERDYLKTRAAELEAQLIETRNQVRALEQVKAIAESPALSSYQKITARVIGRDIDPWFNSVVIDVGSNAGIVKDQPVVTPEGLVGRVIVVSPVSARVQLLTDERFGAGALLAQTTGGQLLGVLRGRSTGMCELRFISAPSKLENGEQVITSGQDQLYPKGLLIGQVKNLPAQGAIPQAVDVEPAAPLTRLETVAVLLLDPETLRLKYDELTKQEKEQERQKQDKGPHRRRRDAGASPRR